VPWVYRPIQYPLKHWGRPPLPHPDGQHLPPHPSTTISQVPATTQPHFHSLVGPTHPHLYCNPFPFSDSRQEDQGAGGGGSQDHQLIPATAAPGRSGQSQETAGQEDGMNCPIFYSLHLLSNFKKYFIVFNIS